MHQNTLVIACKGAMELPLSELVEFQGELKSLSVKNYQKLKREIIEQGFSFPLNVWLHEKKWFCIDGHQRIRTLRKMQKEGWIIPLLPCSIVEADDYQQAKRKLLGAASQYGKFEEEGLLYYVEETNITPEELVARFDFADFNTMRFIESNYDGFGPAPEDKPEKKADLLEEKLGHTCPSCGFSF